MIRVLFLFSVVFLAACQTEKPIFHIYGPDGHRNDFLYMAESTNVPPVARKAMMAFLSPAEIVESEEIVYKHFGMIHQAAQFNLRVFLKIGNRWDRDYQFLLRTYTREGKFIDSFVLAEWVTETKSYCFGELYLDMVIHQSCEEGQSFRPVARIQEDGRFVRIND